MMKFMLYTTDHQLIQRAMPRGLRLSYTLNEELMMFTLNQILLGQYNEGRWNGGMVQASERKKTASRVLVGNHEVQRPLEKTQAQMGE